MRIGQIPDQRSEQKCHGTHKNSLGPNRKRGRRKKRREDDDPAHTNQGEEHRTEKARPRTHLNRSWITRQLSRGTGAAPKSEAPCKPPVARETTACRQAG